MLTRRRPFLILFCVIFLFLACPSPSTAFIAFPNDGRTAAVLAKSGWVPRLCSIRGGGCLKRWTDRSLFCKDSVARKVSTAVSMSDASLPTSSQSQLRKKGLAVVQTLAGVVLITGLERTTATILALMGLSLPTAPVGMILLFLSMTILQATSKNATQRTLVFFGPAREFYKLNVQLFFSAPLVDLPLALLPIPKVQILKILVVIAIGTVFTILSSAAIVTALLGPNNSARPTPADLPETANSPMPTQTLSRAPSPWPLALLALATSAAFLAAGSQTWSIVALSVAGIQAGKALPARLRTFLPPIVSGAGIVSIAICLAGSISGLGWEQALSSYRTVGGPGRILLSQAAPAVVALGFGLFEQRFLLQRKALPIAGGAAVTTFVSMFSSVLFARLLGLPSTIALGLSPRFITLPIALPVAQALGASTSVAAMGTVLQGILGANIAFRLLTWARCRDPVARGFAIGASAHALGTATAYAQEPESGPTAAVTFLMAGCVAAAIAYVPPLKSLLLLAAGLVAGSR